VLSSLDEARLRGGLVLLCGSFLLPRLMNAYDGLFSWAEERAVDIALDTGWCPGGWSNQTIAKARGWLAHCRHLLLNEVEVAALAGTNDPEDAARDLVACMPAHEAVVVVKRGPRGAIACSGRGELVNIRAMEVALIDTIGAGDIFNAAYLAAVASGSSLADAVRSGVETASVAISTAPRSYASANMRSEGRVR
jgi:sugar/nucleoside kinase (ribokinase family)